MSSNLRGICKPSYPFFSSITISCRYLQVKSAGQFPGRIPSTKPTALLSGRVLPLNGASQRHLRSVATNSYNWDTSKSPYETLELERDADEEQIKVAYRRLVKFYHPDVYDGSGTLEDGETAETRFIKIQAAYELLLDNDKRRVYDTENRVDPLKASQAWVEWLMQKRKAFDQRGDMAIAAWGEQQQRELNLKARRLARSKVDPEEERKLLEKEKKSSLENANNTLRRHTLVLRKRDIMRRKSDDEKRMIINQLLAAEGLELEEEDDKIL
ncbi:unnamed protein product [Cuscuta epithymum]|uniref:J domain-containing protein n=1 Tax=Cuscuta epithymum TaxID=186058 RepID=A0AAV0EYK4_9ASTE|nr:unnamed protein product [Cuscuta epithymum]